MRTLLWTALMVLAAGVQLPADRVYLAYEPEVDSFTYYRSITRLDGAITRPQQYQGLIGFTFAEFQIIPTERVFNTTVVRMQIPRYFFRETPIEVGEGTGEGLTGGAAGGEEGGEMPGGGEQGIPGGPGAPVGGMEREGQQVERSPEELRLSRLLQREWELVLNNHYRIVGTRGLDFKKIRYARNVSALGMDQIVEMAFLPYLPAQEVRLGDSWSIERPITVLGLRTPVRVRITYRLYPRFNFGEICNLDRTICSATQRFFQFPDRLSVSILRRLLGQPGVAGLDTSAVAVVAFSGSRRFSGTETEERTLPETGIIKTIEREYDGELILGGLFVYDLTRPSMLSVYLTQWVRYFRKQYEAEALYTEQEPPLEYYDYIVDFTLQRLTYQFAEKTGLPRYR